MLKELKTKSKSNGHTQSETPDNSNSTSLVKFEKIEGTPFTAVMEKDVWFLTWGEYKLTEDYLTLEDCKEVLETNSWDVLGRFVISVINAYERRKIQEQQILNNQNQ